MIHHNYDYVTNRWVGEGEGWRRRGKEDEEERGGGGGRGRVQKGLRVVYCEYCE